MDIAKHIEEFLDKNKEFKKNNRKIDEKTFEYVLALRNEGFAWLRIVDFFKQELNLDVHVNTLRVSYYKYKKQTRTEAIAKANNRTKAYTEPKAEEKMGSSRSESQKEVPINATEKESAAPVKKELKVGETITIEGVEYVRIAPSFVSDNEELEKKLDQIESDIINGVVTSFAGQPFSIWNGILKRYEPSSRVRDYIDKKIESYRDFTSDEKYNIMSRMGVVSRPFVFLQPVKK